MYETSVQGELSIFYKNFSGIETLRMDSGYYV